MSKHDDAPDVSQWAVAAMGSETVPGITVVIPVYRSEQTIAELVEALHPVLSAHARSFEVILVNDASPDGSWPIIQKLAEQYSWVRGFHLMRNYGQHNAVLCGIRAARHDIIVTMDDDLQHPPDQIPKLLERLAAGFDVVYGIPEVMTHSVLRNVLSRMTKVLMAHAMDSSSIRSINAFRAIRTSIRSAFADYRGPALILDVLLSWGTTRFDAVQVRHEPRKRGKSNYTIGRLVNQLMLLLTGFSTAPLRLATIVGFAFTFFGILIFGYVLTRYLVGGTLPGFPFLASMIALFSGAQLFALGIIGEYLARIFNRSMDRPTYVVREEAGQLLDAGKRDDG